MKKVFIYIDGFNLYHSIDDLGQNHLKWLDLAELGSKLIRHDETLVKVKYFSAYATWRFDSYKRHQEYVKALQSVGVEVIMGNFKRKNVTCKICGRLFSTHEEKETDVNIATHMVTEGIAGDYNRAIIISADTDLNSAVDYARSKIAKAQIDIVAPPKRFSRNNKALFEISVGKIKSSLFPEYLHLTDGTVITRPTHYNPPTI